MAVFVQKTKNDKQPSSTSFSNVTNGSSAKKFTSVDSIQNNEVTFSTPNTEYIINAAAGIKSLSSALQVVAAETLTNVENVVSSLLDNASIDTHKQQVFQFTEEDVNTLQIQLGSVASSRYNSTLSASFLSDMKARTTKAIVDSRNTFIPNVLHVAPVQPMNTIVPTIENVLVDLDTRKGSIDSFYTGISFNILSSDLQDVNLIRVFRAEVDNPTYTRPLSMLSARGVQLISSVKGRKNVSMSAAVKNLTNNGVSSSLNQLNKPNQFTGLSTSADMNGSIIIPPPLSGEFSTPSSDINTPPALQHLDISVTQNINVLFNLQNNPVFGYSISANTSSISVGNSVVGDLQIGRAQAADKYINASTDVIMFNGDDSLRFVEISNFSPGAIFSQIIGNLTEFFFVDETVSYGAGYKYFVTTINSQMVQSARSSIADVTIEGIRVPANPTNVSTVADENSISLTISTNDKLIEKFEIYRYDANPNRATQAVVNIISSQNGFPVQPVLTQIADNDYLLVGEALNNMLNGSTFRDVGVKVGRQYTYRVYSVDIFGNKSESPYEVNSIITDMQDQVVPLKPPSIMAEVDPQTKKMLITFYSNEPTIETMFLERCNLTTGDVDFAPPATSTRVIFGNGRSPLKNSPTLQGEKLVGSDPVTSWMGAFVNNGKQQTFVDQGVQFDNIYQYRIFGVDRYGNKTSYNTSDMLLVNRTAYINAPMNVSASVITDDNYNITGVMLSWQAGSTDVAAADLLGNQNALAQSSTRTLYQVQRRMAGNESWDNFQLTPNTTLFDNVMKGDAPKFRPAYPLLNTSYEYRVKAVQIGNFISNFSIPAVVFVGLVAAAPINMNLTTPSIYTNPFYIMINWDTAQNSGVVDHWVIEKCAVNNFAAASLNVNNPASFAALTYNSFRTIYSESSTFLSYEISMNASGNVGTNSNIITGNNYYMDTQVCFGNSYYYRMRSVGKNGVTSDWTYGGVCLTSQVFENMTAPIYTDLEKRTLALSMQPQVFSKISRKLQNSSMSMQPNYSAPESVMSTPNITYVANSNFE